MNPDKYIKTLHHCIHKVVRNLIPGPQLLFVTRAWALSSITVVLHLKREPFFPLMSGVSDGRGGKTIWCS